MSLASPDELRRRMQWSSGTWTDAEFQEELDETNRSLDTHVDYPFRERIEVVDDSENEYKLKFREIESIEEVFLNNDTVSSGDYTLSEGGDTSIATITFDQSYVDDNFDEGDRLVVEYYPTQLKTIEVRLTAARIAESEFVQAAEEIKKKMSEKMRKLARQSVDRYNSMNSPRRARDNNRGPQL